MTSVGTCGPGIGRSHGFGFEQRVDAVAGAVQRGEHVGDRARPHLDASRRRASSSTGVVSKYERRTSSRPSGSAPGAARRDRARAPSGGRTRTRTARRAAGRAAPGGTSGRGLRPRRASPPRARGRSSRRAGTRGRRRRSGATRRAPRPRRRASRELELAAEVSTAMTCAPCRANAIAFSPRRSRDRARACRDVAAQPQIGFGRDVGSVRDDVGVGIRPRPRCPGVAVRHA